MYSLLFLTCNREERKIKINKILAKTKKEEYTGETRAHKYVCVCTCMHSDIHAKKSHDDAPEQAYSIAPTLITK